VLYGQFLFLAKYCLGDRVKEYNMDGACDAFVIKKYVQGVWLVKHEREIPILTPRCRCEDNIEVDLK